MSSYLRNLLASKWTKVAVFLLCLVPLGDLVYRGFNARLTANPVEFVQHFTGDWTLRFLLITLSITPLRKLLNLAELIRFRRMLGLFAFFYVCLHFLTYIGPDQSFSLAGMWKDVEKRRYITVGFLGFVLLIPSGHYFHEGLDPPPRRAPLANSPSLHLRCCHLRRDSLLLASQIRCPRTANVRRHPGHPSTLAPSHVVRKPKGHASSSRRKNHVPEAVVVPDLSLSSRAKRLFLPRRCLARSSRAQSRDHGLIALWREPGRRLSCAVSSDLANLSF